MTRRRHNGRVEKAVDPFIDEGTRPRQRWRGLVVATVAIAAYAPSMRNLRTLDDVLVEETAAARAHAPLSTLFHRDYFASYNQDTYRPFATFTSMLNHRVGLEPLHAAHAQNILWHAGTSVLVATLAARALAPPAALFAGLVFAVHPAASEPVVSVGFREDTIVGCLVTASLLLTLGRGRARRLLALLAYALALFTKENAIVLPALVVLARLTIERRSGPLDRRALARELAAFGLVTVGYAVVRFGVMASPDAFADPVGGTYAQTLVAVPRIFAHYLRLLVVPWPLIVLYAHMFPLGAPLSSQLPWLLLDVAFVITAVRLARTRPALGFGLLWYAVALTPVLHFVPMRVTAADRFVYLSLVGGAVAAGALLERAQTVATRPAARRALGAVGGAVLLALLVLTERRIPVWHDDVTLWRDTLQHNRRAYIGHLVLAGAFIAADKPQLARRAFEAAIADCPRESQFGRARFCSYYAARLGFFCLNRGDLAGARASFDEALRFEPQYVPAIIGLGGVALSSGDLVAAQLQADLAVRLDPLMPQTRVLLQAFLDDLARATSHFAAPPAPG